MDISTFNGLMCFELIIVKIHESASSYNLSNARDNIVSYLVTSEGKCVFKIFLLKNIFSQQLGSQLKFIRRILI